MALSLEARVLFPDLKLMKWRRRFHLDSRSVA